MNIKHFQAQEVAEERRACHQRLEERGVNSMDDSSARMDSDSFLGSMDSDIHLPTLSLHCHCQQLLQEGGGGVGGAGGEGVAGEEGGDEEFATISLSSTERLIEF